MTIKYQGRSTTLPVEDEADVVERYTSSRCLELNISKVADLRWADAVPASDDSGVGAAGTLTLIIQPTGSAGQTLTIDTISGTPILSSAAADVWRPNITMTGDDPPLRVQLPVKPTRCDAHAFAESGGATAFKIGLHLDGEAGQITLRMSTAGAANAINFARASCGMLTTASES